MPSARHAKTIVTFVFIIKMYLVFVESRAWVLEVKFQCELWSDTTEKVFSIIQELVIRYAAELIFIKSKFE